QSAIRAKAGIHERLMCVTHPAPRETPPSPSLQGMHKCAYPGAVSYEWDPAKAPANLSKHGVDFADAATALADDRALTIRDPRSSPLPNSIHRSPAPTHPANPRIPRETTPPHHPRR